LLIQRLPKFERMVFLEYIFTDFSYDKLSKETGIPKDYLYTTIKTAKKRIQNAIC
jgi:DNA-directed RNA polymerase specialized sigma24 family protein